MFQRFTVVMEYEQKPMLPPPFIIFSHIFLLVKFLKRKLKGKEETYDNALKLFLDKDDLERLYDFEEECVEGYFRYFEFLFLPQIELLELFAHLCMSTRFELVCQLQRVEDSPVHWTTGLGLDSLKKFSNFPHHLWLLLSDYK